jgi:hypothetical protein
VKTSVRSSRRDGPGRCRGHVERASSPGPPASIRGAGEGERPSVARLAGAGASWWPLRPRERRGLENSPEPRRHCCLASGAAFVLSSVSERGGEEGNADRFWGFFFELIGFGVGLVGSVGFVSIRD